MAKASEDNKELAHPRHSQGVTGFETLEADLLERIHSNRLPQSLLITGSKGVGKASFAFRLARFLLTYIGTKKETSVNLFGEPEADTCGMDISPDHPAFRRIAAESHPDLLVVEPEFDERKKEYKNEISVDSARKVSEFLSLTPAESLWRVVIVDSVDELNRNAANAILKILEEPPARSVILLVSHNPARLLPTIRSRCQVVAAPKLGMDGFLPIFRSFDLQSEEAVEKALAELSAYSPGLAFELWHQNALKAYEQFLRVLSQYPSIPASEVQAFTDEWCRKDGEARWKMLIWVMDMAFSRILKAPHQRFAQEIFAGEGALLTRISANKPVDFWCALWEKSTALGSDAAHIHLDKKLVLFQIFQMMQDETLLAA